MMAPTEQYDLERDAPGTSRDYTPENINAYIARFANAGFFITYNHPTWSLECYREFSQYRGFDAMEICNFGCFTAGFDEENSRYYDRGRVCTRASVVARRQQLRYHIPSYG
jgi:hypothetical protein